MRAEYIRNDFFGTVDFWAYGKKRNKLIVMDYKNGRREVSVEDNLQLWAYTLMIMATHNLNPEIIQHVIYQRENKKSVEYKKEDVLKFRKRIEAIRDKVEEAKDNPEDYVVKGECSLCVSKGIKRCR